MSFFLSLGDVYMSMFSTNVVTTWGRIEGQMGKIEVFDPRSSDIHTENAVQHRKPKQLHTLLENVLKDRLPQTSTPILKADQQLFAINPENHNVYYISRGVIRITHTFNYSRPLNLIQEVGQVTNTLQTVVTYREAEGLRDPIIFPDEIRKNFPVPYF
jgi:hypothetical protein